MDGKTGDDQLFGGGGNDELFGGQGDDRLDGGAGQDVMFGGAGDDTYIVSESSDEVTEYAAEGDDTVESSVDFTLPSHVEKLKLAGTALRGTGNQGSNEITGTSRDNVLSGLDGDDTLHGFSGRDELDGGAGNDKLYGGAGDDILRGGAGNDHYWIDSRGDRVEEGQDEGSDTIYALTNYALWDIYAVEKLVLDGQAREGSGNKHDNEVVGNGLDNRLQGNDGNDKLSGLNGKDTLSGGNGDDELFGGNGDDTLNGGNGKDTLDGGDGDDILRGGHGDDTYVVNRWGERVIEWRGQGVDRVKAQRNYALGKEADIEVLILEGVATFGAGNSRNNEILGNWRNNKLHGNDGNDILSGGNGVDELFGGNGNDTLIGGAGKDTLNGGNGSDRFKFERTSDGGDTISGFQSGRDKIQVVSRNFASLRTGNLSWANFKSAGTRLTSGEAVFLYDSRSGRLTFDSNGNRAGGTTLIATLSGSKTLRANDIQVVSS